MSIEHIKVFRSYRGFAEMKVEAGTHISPLQRTLRMTLTCLNIVDILHEWLSKAMTHLARVMIRSTNNNVICLECVTVTICFYVYMVP